MILRFASSLLVVSSLLCAQIVSGQQSKRFDLKSYPAGTFHTSSHDYPIGKVTVRIIQVKALDEGRSTNPSLCRAWLQVREGSKILRQAYFNDIDAVGGSYGIFLPKHQPFSDYFLALKEGDYDGRLLLVGEDGSLTNLPGGDLSLTPDKRFIIGSHDSDYQSLFAIDVAHRRLAIDGEKGSLPPVGGLYVDKAGYFFTGDDESGEPPDPNLKTMAIYRLDLTRFTVKKSTIAVDRLKSIREVKSVPWQKSPDCTSAP